MPPLAGQFADAKRNIEPKDEDVSNAQTAHQEVREALETSKDLKAAGIDTILIGSYARHVSIHRMRDVDVFSKLPDLPEEISADQLLDDFEGVLVDTFGTDRVDKQERSVKIEFPDFDLSVDAVPARPCDEHWEIPAGDDDWQETDPLKLGELTTNANDSNDGHYVPTVKLMRQVRRAHLGDYQPGGLYIEIATYHAFDEGLEAEDAPGYFVAALEGVRDQLKTAAESGLQDPSLPGSLIETRATREELETATEVFADCARDAREALESDDACGAAKRFRDVLGKDSDDDWVFPMPSYCNDDGTRKSSVDGLAAGSSQIPGGDRRYA